MSRLRLNYRILRRSDQTYSDGRPEPEFSLDVRTWFTSGALWRHLLAVKRRDPAMEVYRDCVVEVTQDIDPSDGGGWRKVCTPSVKEFYRMCLNVYKRPEWMEEGVAA